jgi:hypothetical protein
MAFIRGKQSGGHTYYQVVESYRPEGSKTPRQRVLAYMGKHATIEDALAEWEPRIEILRRWAGEEARERGYEDVQECLKVLPGIAAARRVREAEDLEGRVKVLCSLR